VPEEVPSQAPSQRHPTSDKYGGPDSLTRHFGSEAVPNGTKYEGGPRRAAERKEGPQVGEGPRGGYRFDLASRTNPASNQIETPMKTTGVLRVFTSLDANKDLRIERGRSQISY